MPAGSAAFVALPPLLSRRQGLCRLASTAALYGVACASSLLPQEENAATFRCSAANPPGCFVLPWKYGMEDDWTITHPDYPRPDSISISQADPVAALQKLP
jgi:hypothetical protein